MATTVQDILTPAIASSLSNNQGNSPLANAPSELVAVVSRTVRQVYAQAGLPPSGGGGGYGNYFTRTTTLTLGSPATTPVALPANPTYAYIPTFTDAGGTVVAVVTLKDLRDHVAEYPPAVVVADNHVYSAGRTGDPTAGAVLTLDGSYLPADLQATTDYIGATILNDPTTTAWPSHVGDPFLIADLALYLAQKDGARDAQEIGLLTQQRTDALARLGQVIGLAQALTTQVRPQAGSGR